MSENNQDNTDKPNTSTSGLSVIPKKITTWLNRLKSSWTIDSTEEIDQETLPPSKRIRLSNNDERIDMPVNNLPTSTYISRQSEIITRTDDRNSTTPRIFHTDSLGLLSRKRQFDDTNNDNTSSTLSSGTSTTATLSREPSRKIPGLFDSPKQTRSRSEVSSPFYRGETMYGGASASRMNNLVMTSPHVARRSTVVRPPANHEGYILSQETKKILSVLEKCSSPVNEARKIPRLKSDGSTIQSFLNQTQSIKSNKYRELHVPSIPELLKLKVSKLNDSTHAARQIAASRSSSIDVSRAIRRYNNDTTPKNPSNYMRRKLIAMRNVGTIREDSYENFESEEIDGNESISPQQDSFLFSKPKSVYLKSDPVSPNDSLKFGFTTPKRRGAIHPVTMQNEIDPLMMNFVTNKDSEWECQNCLVKNTNDKANCVCCNALKLDQEKKQNECIPSIIVTNKAESPIKKFSDDKNSQWECSSCMVRNSNDINNCVCCNSLKWKNVQAGNAKIETSTIVDPLFKKFIANNSKWECSSCLVQNINENQNCICCNASKTGVNTSTPVKNIEATPKNTDPLFKKLMNDKDSKWDCPSCMVKNSNENEKCVCCETQKPDKNTENPKSTDPLFMKFVADKDLKWECSSCMVKNSNDIDECACCSTKRFQDDKKSTSEKLKTNESSTNNIKEKEKLDSSLVSSGSMKRSFTSTTTTFKFGIPPKETLTDNKTETTSICQTPESKNTLVFGFAPPKESKDSKLVKTELSTAPTQTSFNFGIPAKVTNSSTTAPSEIPKAVPAAKPPPQAVFGNLDSNVNKDTNKSAASITSLFSTTKTNQSETVSQDVSKQNKTSDFVFGSSSALPSASTSTSSPIFSLKPPFSNTTEKQGNRSTSPSISVPSEQTPASTSSLFSLSSSAASTTLFSLGSSSTKTTTPAPTFAFPNSSEFKLPTSTTAATPAPASSTPASLFQETTATSSAKPFNFSNPQTNNTPSSPLTPGKLLPSVSSPPTFATNSTFSFGSVAVTQPTFNALNTPPAQSKPSAITTGSNTNTSLFSSPNTSFATKSSVPFGTFGSNTTSMESSKKFHFVLNSDTAEKKPDSVFCFAGKPTDNTQVNPEQSSMFGCHQNSANIFGSSSLQQNNMNFNNNPQTTTSLFAVNNQSASSESPFGIANHNPPAFGVINHNAPVENKTSNLFMTPPQNTSMFANNNIGVPKFNMAPANPAPTPSFNFSSAPATPLFGFGSFNQQQQQQSIPGQQQSPIFSFGANPAAPSPAASGMQFNIGAAPSSISNRRVRKAVRRQKHD